MYIQKQSRKIRAIDSVSIEFQEAVSTVAEKAQEMFVGKPEF